MVSFLYRSKNGFETLDAFKEGAWVCAESPSEEEVEMLVSEYAIEHDFITDALDTHEIPRLETENGTVYLYVRVPVPGETSEVVTSPALIVISHRAVVTVSRDPYLREIALQSAAPAHTKERRRFALYLLGSVLSAYARSLSTMGKQIRRLRVYPKNVKEVDILNFVTQESVLNDYESSLTPLSDIYKSIKHQFSVYEEKIEDLELATEQLINSCEINLKTIVNLRESYSAIATNNLNRVIRVLTALTILLTVPTIVASFFGMNVHLPFAESPHALPTILLITLGISVLLYLFFRWRRWL